VGSATSWAISSLVLLEGLSASLALISVSKSGF